MSERAQSPGEDSRAGLLIGIARGAIEAELGREETSDRETSVSPTRPAWLAAPAATFVTLKLDGRLRGCIGSLTARRSLLDDLVGNARAAAFEDPRFPALTAQELVGLEVEVSILSEPVALEYEGEPELLDALRPGIDGLVLECGTHRSTFLPQVWENLPDPEEFLGALKRKAGLESQFWSDEMRFFRYTVEKYCEDG